MIVTLTMNPSVATASIAVRASSWSGVVRGVRSFVTRDTIPAGTMRPGTL